MTILPGRYTILTASGRLTVETEGRVFYAGGRPLVTVRAVDGVFCDVTGAWSASSVVRADFLEEA